jgi:hypothetical protein
VVFHWPPSELEKLSFADVMAWRERAAKRNGSEE